MRMTETLRKCTLVSNIMTGKHEGLHVHFEDFADLVKDECLDAESWQEKNAELMALETTFDIYMEAHPNASPEVKMLVTKVIDFIRRMRKHFNEYYSSMHHKSHHNFFPETQPCNIQASTEGQTEPTKVKTNLSVVDTVEYIYWCHENIFPHLQINEVRVMVNIFLGTNITKRQLYANYANIKTRQGMRRSDSDKEKTMALFMQRSTNKLHERISTEAIADDNRTK